jgi:hypothetical protein
MRTSQVLKCGTFCFVIDGIIFLDNTSKHDFGKNKRWLKVMVKSLYLISAMKLDGSLGVQLKALDGGEWSTSCSGHLTFSRFLLGGWLTPRASLDGVKNRRISLSTGN